MFKVYDIDIIEMILNEFKIDNIVLSGLSDEKIVKIILDYCDKNDASYTAIDSKEYPQIDSIKGHTLNVLPTLGNFDAIFINDDPNWYTVYNELNCIKKRNDDFPLTFICNDVFPHKYRDAYINPEIIPDEYLNDFSLKLPLNDDVFINDGFYHACDENTPKNGVSVAISDFLNENPGIGVMDLKLINGITILYPKNSINQIRFGKLCDNLEDHDLQLDISDEIIENQILTKYISYFDISENDLDMMEDFKLKISEKEKIIDDFEYNVNLYENELDYKNSQIEENTHKLNLKDSKIRDLESKLYNKMNEIQYANDSIEQVNNQMESLKNDFNVKENEFQVKENQYNVQIESANVEIDSLKKNISQKEKDFHDREAEFNNQINILKKQNSDNNDKLSEMNSNIIYKNSQIRIKEGELLDKSNKLNHLMKQSNNQIAKLENNEYCISCYKEEIKNNNLEIQYLKSSNFFKNLLSPLEYLVLIFKSSPKELSLNFKLYKALKSSKCFDIGYYLSNNEDVIASNWCRYFSPELHYVCNGFNEKRKFNKKYFNRNSKKELLDYILNCNY